MRMMSCTLALLLGFATSAQAQTVERIEPANWWVGMVHHEVELMVHGKGIAATEPRITREGVKLVGVQRSDNPNYLFVTVDVAADARPGDVVIDFQRKGRTTATHTWRIDAREPGSAQRTGFSSADAIYLLMPDRFANGDPSNDSVAGLKEAANRGDANGRHGGDIAGIRKHLDYIAGLGFTQIWSTPLLENDQSTYSYHGYAVSDLYRIDARLGSNADYRDLSREAKARGVGIIMDVVLNHIGSEHWWMRDLPAKDWINNGAKFTPTNHRRTTIQDPHAAPADRTGFTDGWFVDAMPDLNQRNPHLARYLIQNTLWWIEYAGLSGIREDTFGYADTQFVSDWAKAVLDEYPGFSMVGEEWSINPAVVAHWQRGKTNPDGHVPHMPSMMDFPINLSLRTALQQPDAWDGGWLPLYEMLGNDFLYPDPGKLVVFAENHDTSRLLAHLKNDVGLWKIGMAYIATVRGTPQFFYGSEVLLQGPVERHDGELRKDMPGGWAGDATDAFTGNDLSAEARDAQDYIRALFNWRKRNPLLHDGRLMHFAPLNDETYVYFRHAGTPDAPGKSVMVALNKGKDAKPLALERFATFLHGRSARDALTGKPVTLGKTLMLPGKSATLLEIL
ncbi:MAG: glycoside hydrolase family 13 protein [Thermomonas sp.]|uniref:glycoside hydrolase family 13 protein n=1 Tax=Thermomonas sp. TaxID=1971895 RepID=UPI0039E492B9